MKKLIFTLKQQVLLLVMLCCSMSLMAQQVVVDINTKYTANGAGGTNETSVLESAILAVPYTVEEIAAITDLKIITSGGAFLDPKDFTYLNTNLTSLANLDLSESTVTRDNAAVVRNDIPANAFKANSSIKTISFPSSLTGIGAGAFMSSALEGIITLPSKIPATSAEHGIFGNSQGITGFAIAADAPNITVVDGVVFNKDMSTLHYYPCGKTDAAYQIPENVVTIRNSAFECNYNLKDLTFASTTTTLQAGANRFDATANFSTIENIFVAEGNPVLASVNGVLYQTATNRVVWSPKGKTQLIITEPIQIFAGGGSQNSVFGGNGKTDFGDGLGSQNNNYAKVVTLVDLPETLESIEDGAFVATDELVTFICRATNVPVNKSQSFNNVGSSIGWNTKVYVPASALDDYKASTWVNGTMGDNGKGGTTAYKGFALNNFFGFYDIALTYATTQSSIGTDIALENDALTVTADAAPVGKIFKKWTSTTHPELLTDQDTKTTINITMPAAALELTATYEDDTTVGIGNIENTNSEFVIYPNPATDYIKLAGVADSNFVIYNVAGQQVSEGVANNEPISVSGLANGIYILKTDGKAMRFIKK
ncbi:leucine-rich repeat protein [Dysgonomonas sp. 520]|uniref:leucine-rich repeat protein n=1 Tax=Dysgonomonas sp. 520 TaxID=2302931 RepID=UPI0013D4BB1B|nr:leucine-rich repeat protein [Dysgonomonas sp. 520]NDW09958.1 T9SS C-terminal target domain-containing protein [Dysgonomonas sp. 520]